MSAASPPWTARRVGRVAVGVALALAVGALAYWALWAEWGTVRRGMTHFCRGDNRIDALCWPELRYILPYLAFVLVLALAEAVQTLANRLLAEPEPGGADHARSEPGP